MRLVNLAHGDFLVVGAYAGLFFLQFTGIDPLLGAAGGRALRRRCWRCRVYRLLLAPLANRGAEAQMMTMFAVSIILENVFVLAFSADTRSIARDYATLPLTLGPVTCPLIYVIGFAISVSADPGRPLAGLAHRFGRDLRASAVDAAGRGDARRRCQTRADADFRAGRGMRRRRRHTDRRRFPVRRRPAAAPICSTASPSWCSAGLAACSARLVGGHCARRPAKRRRPGARRRLSRPRRHGAVSAGAGIPARRLSGAGTDMSEAVASCPHRFHAPGAGLVEVAVLVGALRRALVRAGFRRRLLAADRLSHA